MINVRTWRSTCVKTSWTNCHTFILDMLKCCSAVLKMFIRNSLVSWSVVALWNTINRWCGSDLSMHYTYATYMYTYLCLWYTVPLLSKGHQVYFYQFNSFMSYLANRTLWKHIIPDTCAASHTHVFHVSHSALVILIWGYTLDVYDMVAWSHAQCSLTAQTFSSLVSRAQHVSRKLWNWYLIFWISQHLEIEIEISYKMINRVC